MQYSVDKKINEIERWDAVASTWKFENETQLEYIMDSIAEVDKYEFGIADNALFSKENSHFDDDIKIMAFQENSKLHVLETETGSLIKDNDEVLISKDLITDYKLAIGERIYLKSIYSNNSHKFKIVGTVNDMALETIFLSIVASQEVVEEISKVNVIYFTSEDNLDKAVDNIQDLPQIQNVVKKDALKEEFNNLTEMFLVIFLIMGIILTVFGLALISIILKAIIEYRMEDYANMKALGMQDSEIKKSLILEVSFYLICSLTIGIFLGLAITYQVIQQYSFILPGLHFNIAITSYVYFSINVFVIVFISLWLQVRKIKSMNISDITKKKTFG